VRSRRSYPGCETASSGESSSDGLLLALMVCLLLASMVALLVFPAGPARGAATFPTNFSGSLVADGLVAPTAMDFAPDGRLFVAEQRGTLRIVEADGTLTTFLDISAKADASGERGLLGVAFDPNFFKNQRVYVYYTREATRTTPAHNRVVRFTASGDRAVAGSEKLILRLNNLSSATNHNGGAIHFGEDGKLYIAVGDNADAQNAQTLRNLKGKMLRINKDGTIPADNPFFDSARRKNRAIWALGLRNPFSFAVQPDTGTIVINDVGAATWEEINRGIAGSNYGWPVHEGPESVPDDYEPPIFAYRHDAAGTEGGCAITGGSFYNPQTIQFPESYEGDYFFADFCRGWIRSYDPATGTASEFATGLELPVDLKVGDDGSLYYLTRGGASGAVSKVSYTSG
jgi:glucose/arabinose dehydrogenase